jgi:hypothetical protein
MNQDYYKFIVSPQNIKTDISKVNYDGETVGVYSGMSSILSSGTNGTSLLTGLTINVLLRQTSVDSGYYTPFDGAIYQKDVVANFIFSANTNTPYQYYVYNTSDEFKKFLELSVYNIDWGDGSQIEEFNIFTPNYLTHTYPEVNKTYTIKLTQNNPWGTNIVEKTIKVPYKLELPINPKGTAFFKPLGGSWSATPISYDYIFSGDQYNLITDQVSSNYVSVPYTVSGFTKSSVYELEIYGPISYQVGVPIIKNGKIFGAITDINDVYTAYTINEVLYYDYSDGITIFFVNSSGFTNDNITETPITKDESLLKVMDQPQIQSNVFIERGKNSVYERILRLGEVDNLGDLINYGYGFFNVENKD